MTATTNELYEALLRLGEESICDLLEISAEDLLDRFSDKIELKRDSLEYTLDLDDDNDE